MPRKSMDDLARFAESWLMMAELTIFIQKIGILFKEHEMKICKSEPEPNVRIKMWIPNSPESVQSIMLNLTELELVELFHGNTYLSGRVGGMEMTTERLDT